MGILASIKKLVHGSEEEPFAVPEGPSAIKIQPVDERGSAKIAGKTRIVVSTKPQRMKDTANGTTTDSSEFQGFPASIGKCAFAIVPTEPVACLLTREPRISVACERRADGLYILVPDTAWFEAASAGITDLPADVEVIRAYIADKDWQGLDGGTKPIGPLDIQIVGGAHDAAGGQLMNFYAGDRLVATLPNKSYSFQKIRRKHPDHILAATAEELEQDHRGSRYCVNVFVS